jgi:hypothetical protein
MNVRSTLIAVSGALAIAACGGSPSDGSRTAPTAEPALSTSKDYGDYVLHFNAISTDQLQPEVARAYNIVRSKSQAMLNVTILRKVPGGADQPVPGQVEVDTSNLTGQAKNITLRQINEGEAIYYIGQVSVANRETLIFDISATPEGEDSAYSVRFTQQFYTD